VHVSDGQSAALGSQLTPVLNSHLERDVVAHQRSLFDNATSPLAGRPDIPLHADPIIEDRTALLQWAGDGDAAPCDLLYFFCHARAPVQFGEAGFPAQAEDLWDGATIGFADDDQNDSVTLQDIIHAWGQIRERQPLVFLNACATTQTDSIYGAPFVKHFFENWKARALVGTDWSVPTRFADVFSRRVLAALYRGQRLNVALREASDAAFAQGSPYPLMYALHGLSILQFSQELVRA
jgi:hypothetical protein